MAHSPENVVEFVCSNCQVTHAGTPVHRSAGDHQFEPPEACGACGATAFVPTSEWIHHHE
ncbi:MULTISPECIES: hypothetical protein [Halomicrobium]|uniref:Small CPxCG-related zinc finger protein n=2 Tax=Halomicrobium mukohataei TaxID=57705 RepID=C7NZK7_HALMD|nr:MULTISPECIES: hypothetical protein [Halomicrobium]ACV48775.1 hypothetical protein Hmuk_2669 [Halomicrobium mukohataei DSM 12286]MBO4246481.1 hypothetical protein [Halomicrobium sp. IBSBa]NLV10996.1 hypothetical protein [Halomicrobium mukohataei]QCD64205.1 hypothetical protein E5139_00635 [Halomicrobium mukohataei]QFR19011.1 hypothetical protein GBQ70_00635 [Halomicrobium sp. ZPS1]